jgi:dTDP-4-dehydrorhamnose 3,5-epimerase
MIFEPLAVEGAFLVHPELREDERGFFARAWCEAEFAEQRLAATVAQCNISFNKARGTLRGLHFQAPPHAETKLVRCTRGAIFDVIVDLRDESPTRRCHAGLTLTADNHQMVYVPEGCAHGFLTLTDNAEVFYQMSAVHRPEAAGGVRWDDPALGIAWPGSVEVISGRDTRWPFL